MLLDVTGIALNFVLRAVAGVAVLAAHVVTDFGGPGGQDPGVGNVLLSPWLLVCTFFGALFLAFAKRRKTLRNALADWLTPGAIAAEGIDPRVRDRRS